MSKWVTGVSVWDWDGNRYNRWADQTIVCETVDEAQAKAIEIAEKITANQTWSDFTQTHDYGRWERGSKEFTIVPNKKNPLGKRRVHYSQWLSFVLPWQDSD